MKPETITTVLGREELALLLHIFHAPTLLGLDENPLEGMTEEQAAAAMVTAERALRARGLIRILEKENRIEVEPITMALVGSCLQPLYSVRISVQFQGEDLRTRYYHIARHLTVEHASPETGLHEFTGVAEVKDMVPRMLAFLRLGDQVAPACAEGRVRESVLSQARDLAGSGNAGAARAALVQDGLAEGTSQALVETLADPLSNSSAIRVEYGEPRSQQVRGFSLLEGRNGLWLLVPEEMGDENPEVMLQPVTASAAHSRLEALLES
jgi:hypothetical protein